MKHSFFYFLSSALIPELRSDIAAGTSCNVHLRLILIAAVGATPHKLAVLLDYLYFSVIAAHLAIIRLCIKLGVHNIVVDKLHYLKYRRDVLLHIGHLDIRNSAARRELLEFGFKLKFTECVYLSVTWI